MADVRGPKELGDYANSMCWPSRQKSRGKYNGGSKYPKYAEEFNKIKPQNASSIKIKQWREGASCDIFVGCAVRGFGITNFPVTLRTQADYFFIKKNYTADFDLVTTSGNKNNMKHGDVVIGIKKGSSNNGQGHIFIVNGNGSSSKRSNAHYVSKYYAVVDGFSNINTSKYKYFGVFRVKTKARDGSYVTPVSSISAEDDSVMYGEDTGQSIVLENEIAKLYSSNNFQWLLEQEEEESESQKAIKTKQEAIKNYLANIDLSSDPYLNAAPLDVVVSYSPTTSTVKPEFKLDRIKSRGSTQNLISYPNLVEAPVIELSFNGITIGGYNNTGDKYPNYISSMTVSKINGRINTYTINLVYQIRAGEDPNFIDKLLSRTGYTKPLKIRYGDSNSPGLMFKEESAIITDVRSRDNVSGSSISYTIQAISSITSASKSYFTFSETTGKPSTILNDLLYNSGQKSAQLLEAFPRMKDRTFVNSNNLIPNNDIEVTVGGMADVSPLVYLTHVVSCMQSMTNSASSYFLSFNDSADGAYFSISEVCAVMDSNVLYEIDVGYPGNNFVTNFQLCDNIYWPLVYEYNSSIPRWNYDIDNNGNIVKIGSNSLFINNKFLSENIIDKNWWTSLSEFPISAKITLKGLTIPLLLMTYIRINTLFYGQQDIASGIYVVTDQTDSISGNGYSTTLTLLRVSD